MDVSLSMLMICRLCRAPVEQFVCSRLSTSRLANPKLLITRSQPRTFATHTPKALLRRQLTLKHDILHCPGDQHGLPQRLLSPSLHLPTTIKPLHSSFSTSSPLPSKPKIGGHQRSAGRHGARQSPRTSKASLRAPSSLETLLFFHHTRA